MQYKTIIHYLSSNVLNSFIGLASGFVTYRYIDPSLLGIWATFTVFEVYATITRFGVVNGMNRELPFELGRNNIDLAKSYASTTLGYTILSYSFLIIIIPTVLFKLNVNIGNYNFFICLIAIILRILAESYSTYLTGTISSNAHFDKLSKIQYVQSIFRVLTIGLIVLYGFYGLIARELFLSILQMMQLHWARTFHLKPSLKLAVLKKLVQTGFPLFILSFLISTIDTIPRVFLIKYGTTELVGLFSPILILLNSASLIPNAISSYLYPKLSFDWGKNNNLLSLWRRVKLTLLISILISLPLSILVFLFSDYLMHFFPKYANVTPYLKISCLSMLFISYKVGNVILAIVKKWNYLIIYTFLYFSIQVLSIIILKKMGLNSLSVATFSQVITFSLMYIAAFVFTYKVTHPQILNA
jgi:O-antigen/teichoic acid export membrane protein